MSTLLDILMATSACLLGTFACNILFAALYPELLSILHAEMVYWMQLKKKYSFHSHFVSLYIFPFGIDTNDIEQ